MSMIITNSKK